MNKKTKSTEEYSVEKIKKLEQRISQKFFCGVPIGCVLNDYFITQLYCKIGDSSKRRDILRLYATVIYRVLKSLLPKKKISTLGNRKVWLTCFTNLKKSYNMIYPIIDSIGAEKCLLIKNGQSAVKIFKEIYEIDYEDALKTPSTIWIKEYLLNFLKWNNHIKNVCKELSLPYHIFVNITARLMVSTQYISGWIYLLLKNKPSIVITESDRNSMWSTVILAAKILGIPTATLVHGVINENAIGYSPVVADDILCWGNLQRDRLIEEGVDKNRIRVVGCPRLKDKSCLSSEQVKSKIGAPLELNAIMLATSPVSDEESNEIVTTFCEAGKMEKSWYFFVKLHPSENRSRYKQLIDKYQNVHFFEESELSIECAIAASDVVVVKDSGVGGDAIILGKSVIVLSPNGKPKGYGRELVERAGCPLATNEKELRYEITGCLAAKDKPNFITAKYVEDFCIAFGEDSAKRISQYILEKM